MTKEEASRDIEEIKEIINCNADVEIKFKMISNTIYSKPHYYKVLQQEPCGDAISREDALQALCKAVHKNDDTIPCLNQRVSCLWDKTKVQDYAEEILKLPSVKPTEKVGHWEWVQCRNHSTFGNWICSKCKCVVAEYVRKENTLGIPTYKFCPNCGSRMMQKVEE